MRRSKKFNKRYKMIAQRRSKKIERRRIKARDRIKRIRRIKYEQNYRIGLLKKKDASLYYEKQRYKDFKIRKAPVIFSIIDNCDGVIAFLNNLRKDYHSRRKVFVDMQGVTKVTNESLCLLVSNMMLFRNGRIDFNGNFPKDKQACKIVIESGFLETLYRKKASNTVNKVSSAIYTYSDHRSHSATADAIIRSCSKFLWDEECTCSGVYNAFIELMTNTVEHADEIEGKQKWWVTATKDEENEKVTFSFVDYGRGIINTLTNANQKRHKNIVEKLLVKWLGNEAMLLKEVMEGALTLSEKGGSQYGNGLNSIYQDMVDNQLNNLVIITNNVFADVSKSKYSRMNESFPGAFISWEINKNTKHELLCSNPVYTEIGTEIY